MSFTASIFGPPQVLLLLLLNHAFHNALNLQACPELYARVFGFYFDLGFSGKRIHSSFSSQCLAAELVRRFYVLRRIRLLDFSEQTIRVDLWTAYLMLLESDGANEKMLAAAGMSGFIVELIKRRLREQYVKYGRPLVNEVNSLALWLACLTVSPREYLIANRFELNLTIDRDNGERISRGSI
jgi:hypothetical protein